MKNVDVYNTHIELYPYKKDEYPVIELMYTATDKFTGENFPCGYILDNNILYLPRGTSIARLEDITGAKANYMGETDPVDLMSEQHCSYNEPRDPIQHQSIKFLKSHPGQLGLNLKTGLGKCEPISRKIPSPDDPKGYKLMGEIQPGDRVYGSSGKPVTVLQTFPQGVKSIWKITLSNGLFALCGLEHLWAIRINKKIFVLDCEFILKAFKYPTDKEIEIPIFTDESMTTQEWIPIKSVEYSHEEEAQCIMVDSADHLYVTEQYIITHNTFCVAYASTELREKTLIITPDDSLKRQWMNTYRNMFDYRPSQLLNIAGSHVIESIMQDNYDPADVYFVNHQTLHSYLMNTNGYIFHQFFKKLKIGIKVYDESHKEFGNILMVDFFTNTNRTWYLTATFDRSDKTESACFQKAFQSVDTFGEEESSQVVKKHVIYHTVNVNSRISPANRARLMAYPGFAATKYGKYAFFEDPTDTMYGAILNILRKTMDVEGKTLIFVPLIEAVDVIVSKLKRDLPEKTIAAYHSKISRDEKEDAEKRDIIVSTIKSCGTGRDIKGLRSVICCEPIASKVVIEQVIGRLRPYAPDKDTYYWDIVDRSIQPVNWWHKARFKKITTLVKKTINLDM